MDTEVEYEMDLKLACVWNLEERIYADEVFGRGSYDRTTTGLWPGIGGMDVYPTARNLTFGVQITY